MDSILKNTFCRISTYTPTYFYFSKTLNAELLLSEYFYDVVLVLLSKYMILICTTSYSCDHRGSTSTATAIVAITVLFL